MDLNASPLPEEDEDDAFQLQIGEDEDEEIEQEHRETGVETLRREREERIRRMKRKQTDDVPKRDMQVHKNDSIVSTRNFRSYDRSKLPPGWLDCPGLGQAIGYIIPSKVPLGESFYDCIMPGKRYSSRQVIRQLGSKKLGLVIDLTNTSRYYSPSEWSNQGIKHFKIACKGRDAVPDNESVNNFVYEVLQFLSNQKHSPRYVLVHCTHGHNRTGFMIIHYLIRSHHVSVTKALQIFSNARPPGIYKEEYIDALYKFYHEKRPEIVTCPPTPEWKRSCDLDLNGNAEDDEDKDGLVAGTSPEELMENKVMTNDDVLGDAIPYYQQDYFRKFCYRALKWPAGNKGYSQFLGSHPVSLNRENLQLLRQRYYYATWKADGTRYMMLITSEGCYLIDRNFNFRRVQMRFPMKPTNEGHHSDRTHDLTLLDGEMVIDTMPTTQMQERRYLIYDLMAINSQSVVELPFSERWKLIEKEVIEPRNYERSYILQTGNPHYRYDMEPFRVRRKDFWLLSTVDKLLMEFIPKLSHEADGLIFQVKVVKQSEHTVYETFLRFIWIFYMGWDDPYVPKTHEGLLKWKYAEMNSVDFLFEVDDDSNQRLYLFERGKKKQLDGNRVTFKGVSDFSSYSGKIIECGWDREEQSWVFMRIRTDKANPNEFNTYIKVMRSIKDNITEEVLLKEIHEIICLPMYADRTRIDKAHMRQHHANRRK